MPYAKYSFKIMNSRGKKNDVRETPAEIYSQEMMNMPWYMNPASTCKVLNRIANRYPQATLKDLQRIMDHATQKLWNKQEYFHEKNAAHRKGH